MKVKDLQQFLGSFTQGSEAVKNAVIFVKTEKPSSLILPDKLQKDY
jgi:hypothetical protein